MNKSKRGLEPLLIPRSRSRGCLLSTSAPAPARQCPLCYTLPYMDKNTKDILETLTFIKDRMATKDDVRDIIREEVPPMIEAAIQKTVPPMIEEALRPIFTSCTRSAKTWKTCVVASKIWPATARRSITRSSASPPLKSISASTANRSPDQRAAHAAAIFIRPLVLSLHLFPSKSGLARKITLHGSYPGNSLS